MIEAFYAVVVGALLWFHCRASERWDAERARLVAAALAPTPAAAAAAVDPTPPAKRDEAPPRRSVAIGNGGL